MEKAENVEPSYFNLPLIKKLNTQQIGSEHGCFVRVMVVNDIYVN